MFKTNPNASKGLAVILVSFCVYVCFWRNEKPADFDVTPTRSQMQRSLFSDGRQELKCSKKNQYCRENSSKTSVRMGAVLPVFCIDVCFGRDEKPAGINMTSIGWIMQWSSFAENEQEWTFQNKTKLRAHFVQCAWWDGYITPSALHWRLLWTRRESGRLQHDPHEKNNAMECLDWKKERALTRSNNTKITRALLMHMMGWVSYSFCFALTSALDAMRIWQTASWPQRDEECNGVHWLKTK